MVQSELFQFVEGNLDLVPQRRGVYELCARNDVVYIGRADRNLQDELRSHLSGSSGIDVSDVTAFRFSMSRVPWLRHDDLLATYRASHYGRVPLRNSLSG